ncbi:MAG: prepilin peptidase [Candidatus Micrarchaeota archaeon]
MQDLIPFTAALAVSGIAGVSDLLKRRVSWQFSVFALCFSVVYGVYLCAESPLSLIIPAVAFIFLTLLWKIGFIGGADAKIISAVCFILPAFAFSIVFFALVLALIQRLALPKIKKRPMMHLLFASVLLHFLFGDLFGLMVSFFNVY